MFRMRSETLSLLKSSAIRPVGIENGCSPPSEMVFGLLNVTVLHALNSCKTVNVWPLIVIVPMREPTVGSTLKLSIALPLPIGAEINLIHGTLLLAVHAHCGSGLVIVTLPIPPVAGNDCLAGEIEKIQATAPKSAR